MPQPSDFYVLIILSVAAKPRRWAPLHNLVCRFKAAASLLVVSAALSPAFSFAAGEVFHAHFRIDSKTRLYETGETAKVEVSFKDKSGRLLEKGVVDVWADDGWTNTVWRREVDLAKERQPVRMEISRSTPGAHRAFFLDDEEKDRAGKKGQVRRAKLGWTSRMKGVCTVKKSAYS